MAISINDDQYAKPNPATFQNIDIPVTDPLAITSSKAANDYVESVLMTLAGLVFILGVDGKILGMNAAAERILGYSHDEINQRVFWDALCPEIERGMF